MDIVYRKTFQRFKMYKSDAKIYIYLENLPPAKEKVEPTEYDPEYLEPLRYINYQFILFLYFLCLAMTYLSI